MSKPAADPVSPLLIAALVGAAVFAVVGWIPFVVVMTLTVLAWVRRLAARLGTDFALAAAVAVALALVLAMPVLANVIPIGLDGAPVVAVAVLGLLAVPGSGRTQRPRRRTLLTWGASALGAIVWLGGVAISRLVPGSSAIGWVMGGDTANNILFARQAMAAGEVRIGPAENPVPLPAALLADALAPGRLAVDASDLLRHDVVEFGATWAAVVALVCLLAGRVLAAFAGSGPSAPYAAALGSVLPLTWFVSGYPIEFGFFNAHVALVLLLASILVVLHARRSPVVALGVLVLLALLVLPTWAPLVLVPGLLGAVLVFRDRRRIVAAHGAELALLGVAAAALLAWGLLVTLPTLVAQGEALAAPGGVFVFSRWFVLALLAGGIAAGLLLVRDVCARGAATLAVTIAVAIGWVVLLYQARTAEDAFASYYPAKLAWQGAVLVVVMGVGVAWRRLAILRWVAVRRGLLAALVLATTVVVVIAPALRTAYMQVPPLARILQGTFAPGGDIATERVFDFADAEHPRVLWRSGDPDERGLNFWSLMMAGGIEVEYLPLRLAAYGDYTDSVDDLCRIAGLVPAELTVATADPGLAERYAAACTEPAVFESR